MRSVLLLLSLLIVFPSFSFAQEDDDWIFDRPIPADPETKEAPKPSEHYHAVYAGVWLDPRLKMSGLVSDGINRTGIDFSYSMKTSFLVGYEWSQNDRHSWNNGFFIDYVSLPFSSYRIVDVSETRSGSAPGNLTIITASYSGKYRWNQFYLSVGIGLSGGEVSGNEDALTKTIKTSLVTWFGCGYFWNESWAIELISRGHSVSFDSVTSGIYTTKSDKNGTLSGFQLTAKYLF